MPTDPLLFQYHAPNDVTKPIFKAIREAETMAWATIHKALTDRHLGQDAGSALVEMTLSEEDQRKATAKRQQLRFEMINNACTVFYDIVEQQVPNCADRTVALRQIRLARMLANEAVHGGCTPERARDALQEARMWACAATAIENAKGQ